MAITRPKLLSVVLAALLAAATCNAQPPPPNQSGFLIERLMSPEVFKNSGLSKLSPSELVGLNRWLSGAIPVIASGIAAANPSQTGAVIETHIDGEFHGWDGETVYKMQNGQIWQQSSYHYHYHYAYSPEVMIYSSGGDYKIRVTNDDDEPITVRRLK